TETVALPLPSAAAGDPARVVPDVESSSRYVIPSCEAKPLSDPVSVAGLEPPEKAANPSVDWPSVRFPAPIVTVPLFVLSVPRQFAPITRAIAYCQLPIRTVALV